MGFRVIFPGFMTTVQDSGRAGFERCGVPSSGPVDWFALRAANLLVGNPPGAAGLEFASDGGLLPPGNSAAPFLVLEADQDALLAVTGRGFRLWVQGRRIGLWMAAWARPGERIEVWAEDRARWGYLAAAGGIAAQPALGSRSTYLRGAFGGLQGRVLQSGDRLPLGQALSRQQCQKRAGCRLLPAFMPPYADEVSLPVVTGPQREYFTQAGMHAFFSAAYRVSTTSDRMGCRLEGPAIERAVQSELLSEAMPPGSVQAPLGGQLIVMLADRPTTGGYPKIGVVARAGLPLVAQLPPGVGQVRFHEVSVEQAREAYRAMLARMDAGIQ